MWILPNGQLTYTVVLSSYILDAVYSAFCIASLRSNVLNSWFTGVFGPAAGSHASILVQCHDDEICREGRLGYGARSPKTIRHYCRYASMSYSFPCTFVFLSVVPFGVKGGLVQDPCSPDALPILSYPFVNTFLVDCPISLSGRAFVSNSAHRC